VPRLSGVTRDRVRSNALLGISSSRSDSSMVTETSGERVLCKTPDAGHRRVVHWLAFNKQRNTRVGTLKRIVGIYFSGSMPRSRHIFLAKSSLISLCRGTDERLFWIGCHHQEWRLPSLRNSQPFDRKCLSRSVLFIWQFFLPNIRFPQQRPLLDG